MEGKWLKYYVISVRALYWDDAILRHALSHTLTLTLTYTGYPNLMLCRNIVLSQHSAWYAFSLITDMTAYTLHIYVVISVWRENEYDQKLYYYLEVGTIHWAFIFYTTPGTIYSVQWHFLNWNRYLIAALSVRFSTVVKTGSAYTSVAFSNFSDIKQYLNSWKK